MDKLIISIWFNFIQFKVLRVANPETSIVVKIHHYSLPIDTILANSETYMTKNATI